MGSVRQIDAWESGEAHRQLLPAGIAPSRLLRRSFSMQTRVFFDSTAPISPVAVVVSIASICRLCIVYSQSRITPIASLILTEYLYLRYHEVAQVLTAGGSAYSFVKAIILELG